MADVNLDTDIIREPPVRIDAAAEVVIVGAGACGLVAALRARAAGAEVIVAERDASPSGSTSMSSGFVPAPATRFQRSIDVLDDTPERFRQDILAKSKGTSNAELAGLAANTIGPALEWLADNAGVNWVVLDDFLYPGHSRHRMHALAEKTGAALEARLLTAAEDAGVSIVTEARARSLFLDGQGRVTAVATERPDGRLETIGCGALVLACNGFGGNSDLVRRHIPEIADGLYYGHPGNTGDAVLWGEALGARLEHMSGYQGHGSLAHPHNILISWALMTRGAIQVNADGNRFSDESAGYSEQAIHVLAQPNGVAWNIYGAAIHEFALSFPDYREAVDAGAITQAGDISELARATGLPEHSLAGALDDVARYRDGLAADPFGRDFRMAEPLEPPFYAVKVTGALFHTQGGPMIDRNARVTNTAGIVFPNLFAGGGAACGVSGPKVTGYLSGNGLLTAIAFGFIAGHQAANERRKAAPRRR